MAHPNEELFRRLVAVWASGDREGAARFFTEDAVFHYPGPGPLHGDHQGREGIVEFWAEQDRLTGGGFRPEFLGLATDDQRVYLLVRFANADGSISFHRAVVYDVEDGVFAGARFFEDDPEAAVAFFSVAGEESRERPVDVDVLTGAGMVPSRFDVASRDGTSIAVFVVGVGQPVVLVHGAMSDHRNDSPFIAELAASFTVCAMDRRGRGASGDHDEYSIEREFEDVAAVVDAVAARFGGPVGLWGHSYGADCAMGAVALTRNVHRLMLYEPGLGMTYPDGSVEAVEAALAAGDKDAAAVAVMAGVVEMTDGEVEYVRSLDTWTARVALVGTVPRELLAESGWVYPSGWLDRVACRTLLLAGGDSPDSQTHATRRAAAALPNSEILVLAGHGHIAHRTNPAKVAEIVERFVSTGSTARRSPEV